MIVCVSIINREPASIAHNNNNNNNNNGGPWNLAVVVKTDCVNVLALKQRVLALTAMDDRYDARLCRIVLYLPSSGWLFEFPDKTLLDDLMGECGLCGSAVYMELGPVRPATSGDDIELAASTFTSDAELALSPLSSLAEDNSSSFQTPVGKNKRKKKKQARCDYKRDVLTNVSLVVGPGGSVPRSFSDYDIQHITEDLSNKEPIDIDGTRNYRFHSSEYADKLTPVSGSKRTADDADLVIDGSDIGKKRTGKSRSK